MAFEVPASFNGSERMSNRTNHVAFRDLRSYGGNIMYEARSGLKYSVVKSLRFYIVSRCEHRMLSNVD